MNGTTESRPGDGVVGSAVGEENNSDRPSEHEALSSHVPDQFPGQFPSESAEPYRPPLAASEGGPGLAAEYYGDAGQSVFRAARLPKALSILDYRTGNLIYYLRPLLQHHHPSQALLEGWEQPRHSSVVNSMRMKLLLAIFSRPRQHIPQHQVKPIVATSTSNLPSLGSAAVGATAAMTAAAGYAMGNHSSSSHQQNTASITGTANEHTSGTGQRPQSESQGSYYSASSKPPTSGSRPSHVDNIPIYATAAAGVAGLAGAVLHNSDHPSAAHGSSSQQFCYTNKRPVIAIVVLLELL